MSDHLKFDTDFLDKDTPQKTGTTNREKPLSEKSKYSWKKILIIGGVILFFGWVILSNSGSSTNSTSNNSYTAPTTNGDNVRNGQYSCSRYDSNQADSLDPSESESQLTIAQNLLTQRGDELDRLKRNIDNSYVNDNSSQYEIDNYNEMVDTYNSKLGSYKRDATSMSSRIDQYNAQVERRNNYLTSHCTKAY